MQVSPTKVISLSSLQPLLSPKSTKLARCSLLHLHKHISIVIILIAPNMVIPASYRRTNRRRERPGARARRALSRKSALSNDISEGFDIAYSPAKLPQGYPSSKRPYAHQDSYWGQKERAEIQEEYQAMLERERIELEMEQRRFFGGDEADDDVSLLPAMLDVVHFLWGGIDYVDP